MHERYTFTKFTKKKSTYSVITERCKKSCLRFRHLETYIYIFLLESGHVAPYQVRNTTLCLKLVIMMKYCGPLTPTTQIGNFLQYADYRLCCSSQIQLRFLWVKWCEIYRKIIQSSQQTNVNKRLYLFQIDVKYGESATRHGIYSRNKTMKIRLRKVHFF